MQYSPGEVISTVSASPSPVMVDNVLSNRDIFDGVILALALSFLFSYLNGRTSSASDVILWSSRAQPDDSLSSQTTTVDRNDEVDQHGSTIDDNNASTDDETKKTVVFSETEWKEMSRPENYVLYSTRVKRRLPLSDNNLVGKDTSVDLVGTLRSAVSTTDLNNESSEQQMRQKWSLIGLLILFVPIFSIEFFFALSRQFVCGAGYANMDGSVGDTLGDISAATKSVSPWAKELCSAHFE